MARERTFGYHPTEQPRIFEIDRDAGETLPDGWVDTPAKLAPKGVEVAAADPQVRGAAPEAGKASDAARLDKLAAELAALTDLVKRLQRPAPKRRKRRRRRNAAKTRAARDTSAEQPTEV